MTSTELQQIFSENLKAARIRAGLNQMKLAELADLSVGYICDLEGKRRWDTPETFAKLADALNMKPFELLLPVSSELQNSDSIEQRKQTRTLVSKIDKSLKNNINTVISDTLSEFLK